jgi:hypothetical protein
MLMCVCTQNANFRNPGVPALCCLLEYLTLIPFTKTVLYNIQCIYCSLICEDWSIGGNFGILRANPSRLEVSHWLFLYGEPLLLLVRCKFNFTI